MKVPEEYGGLGLSQVYYNRALALAGVWHAALSTLLSAHQSIGVAEPLRLFGTEEQKRKWLPLVAKDHISAFLLTEPDVGSDPARLATTRDAGGRRLRADNGQKLWATNGAIADIVVVMAQGARKQRRPPRRDHCVRAALRQRGGHGRAPQRVHGAARDRELGDAPGPRVRSGGEPDRTRGTKA